MKDRLLADLKKYEEEVVAVNKRLAMLEEQKRGVLVHGHRVEGIVAYIRVLLEEMEKPAAETPAQDVPAKAEEGAAQ